MKEAVSTSQAPAALGPYSQGVATEGLVFVSGQLPIDPATGSIPEGITAQTEQSLANIEAILKAQGLDMGSVVKTTVLLANIEDFGAMNEVYGKKFSAPFPARSAFAVKALPKAEALVEIEVIATR